MNALVSPDPFVSTMVSIMRRSYKFLEIVNSLIAQDSQDYFVAFFLIKEYTLPLTELFILRRSTILFI